jgi:glycosyltransferase involved in cell wall biosynthesis
MGSKHSVTASVIMPVHNGERYLSKAIESILSQTFTDFEFIIIDDGSVDNSTNIIKDFAENDDRVKLLQNKNNIGIASSLNKGILSAKGQYITYMHSDDISLPQRFERQIEFLESYTDIGLCGTQVLYVRENAQDSLSTYPLSHEQIICQMLFSNPFCHPAVMFKRKLFLEHNLLYNSEFISAEDYELWFRAVSIIKTANLPECLYHYNFHSGQQSVVFHDRLIYEVQSIQTTYLDKLGIKLSEKEKNFHMYFGFGSMDNTPENFRIAENWIERLRQANNQFLAFPNPQFDQLLEWYLFNACKNTMIILENQIAKLEDEENQTGNLLQHFKKQINKFIKIFVEVISQSKAGQRILLTQRKLINTSKNAHIDLVRASELFDEIYYLNNNPDVRKAEVDPVIHYLKHGGFENRDPSEKFSSKLYFDNNPDVKKVGINPLIHYLQHGQHEGRDIYPAIPNTKCLTDKEIIYPIQTIDKNNNLTENKFSEIQNQNFFKNENEIFNMFWFGQQLTALEKSCILSFLKHDQTVRVFTYQEVQLPDGVINEDASSIIPYDQFFLAFNSPSGFSDLFRYKLLYEHGGWWVDTDILCLQSQIPDCDYFWAEEQPGKICGAVLKFPPKDKICKSLFEIAQEKARNPTSWGWIGPDLLTSALISNKVGNRCGNTELVYPIHWSETHFLCLPEFKPIVESRISNSIFLHCWHSVFKQMDIDISSKPPVGSFLEMIYDQYKQNKPRNPMDVDKIIEGVINYLNEDWIQEHLNIIGKDKNNLLPKPRL